MVYLCDKMNSNTNIEVNEVGRKLDNYLVEHKMRRTPERYAILHAALNLKSQFTIEDLCEKLEQEAYHVSQTTVYNTVQLLVDAAILRSHRFTGQENRYSFAIRQSDDNASVYLVCLECGKIKEVKDNDAAHMLKATQFRGFTPRYQSLCIYGTCAGCRRKTRRNSSSTAKSKIDRSAK